MLDHLINAKGGLHNRITRMLQLKPFDLLQVKQFLAHRDIHLKTTHILDIYMIMGGIPDYLEKIKKSRSVVQNIDSICFQQDGHLISGIFPSVSCVI